MRNVILMVEPIKGKFLTWPNVWEHLKMYKDKGGKWRVGDDTPPEVKHFLDLFGYTHLGTQLEGDTSPPREFVGLNNNQLATIVLFQGFANYLCKKLPELALEIGIGTEVYHGSK